MHSTVLINRNQIPHCTIYTGLNKRSVKNCILKIYKCITVIKQLQYVLPLQLELRLYDKKDLGIIYTTSLQKECIIPIAQEESGKSFQTDFHLHFYLEIAHVIYAVL